MLARDTATGHFRILSDADLRKAATTPPGEGPKRGNVVTGAPLSDTTRKKAEDVIRDFNRELMMREEGAGAEQQSGEGEEGSERAGEAALGAERAHLVHFADAQAIRDEMERCIPLYKGIGTLRGEGESVQYGGALLCAGGYCAGMPEGRARFTALRPPEAALGRPAVDAAERAGLKAAATFALTTRRGKQFNSMVYAENDPITGTARRDAIFISPEDAARLGVAEGEYIVLRAVWENGHAALQRRPEMRGVARIAAVKSGTLR